MTDRVLIVDDDISICRLLEKVMLSNDLEPVIVGSGQEALETIASGHFDLILIDVVLGDMEGFDVIRKIRKEGNNTPVMIVSGRNEDYDSLYGLSVGADDYITKPFRPLELIARVKAQLRRFIHYNPGQEDRDVAEVSGLRIDCRDHTCTLHGKKLSLTPTEFSILWVLCSNKGEVVESDRLFHEVWGDKYYSSNNNTIMVHIRHLREKMKDSAEHPKYIRTVWGVGYKIEG